MLELKSIREECWSKVCNKDHQGMVLQVMVLQVVDLPVILECHHLAMDLLGVIILECHHPDTDLLEVILECLHQGWDNQEWDNQGWVNLV